MEDVEGRSVILDSIAFNYIDVWKALTRSSIERGFIPNICPVCGNSSDTDSGRFLVIHHWGETSKLESILRGNYRRMCYSCNSYLGSPGEGYEFPWKDQFSVLVKRFREIPSFYTQFDGTEKDWSKFLLKELRGVGRIKLLERGTYDASS